MWSFRQEAEQQACVSLGDYRAVVATDDPAAGMALYGHNQDRLADLFGLRFTTAPFSGLAERYVRDGDLVVHYQRDSAQQVRPELYWRARPRSGASADRPDQVEMLLSVETQLLDSRPAVEIVCRLAKGELLAADDSGQFSPATERSASHCWLFRPVLGGDSLALCVPACDPPLIGRRAAQDSRGDGGEEHGGEEHGGEEHGGEEHGGEEHGVDGHELKCTVFDENLEKGVIRRTRIAATVVPRGSDQTQALAVLEQICQAPPPLTV